MSDIDARFHKFNESNPQVLADLEKLAATALAKGCSKLGVKCLWEVLRYNYGLAGTPIRMCNSLTSRFARALIQRNPALSEVIELRSLRAGEPEPDDQQAINWLGFV